MVHTGPFACLLVRIKRRRRHLSVSFLFAYAAPSPGVSVLAVVSRNESGSLVYTLVASTAPRLFCFVFVLGM